MMHYCNSNPSYVIEDNLHKTVVKCTQVQAYTSGLWYYAEYQSFKLDSEANYYRLHVSGYSGDAGDSLANTTLDIKEQHNGKKVSTYDSDNDIQFGGSCAASLNASWWFGSCLYSCLTCAYGSNVFTWYSLDTYDLENIGKLRAAQMKIRSF